jgi:hypothetical protein
MAFTMQVDGINCSALLITFIKELLEKITNKREIRHSRDYCCNAAAVFSSAGPWE